MHEFDMSAVNHVIICKENPSTSLFLPFLLNLFHKNHVYDSKYSQKLERHVRDDELNKKIILREISLKHCTFFINKST